MVLIRLYDRLGITDINQPKGTLNKIIIDGEYYGILNIVEGGYVAYSFVTHSVRLERF